MGRYIAEALSLVVAAAEHTSSAHHHGANGDFILGCGGPGLGKRKAHIIVVGVELCHIKSI